MRARSRARPECVLGMELASALLAPSDGARGLEHRTEGRDQGGQRGRLEKVLDLLAACREVDASVEAVCVLVLEHRVRVVTEPRRPVQVALVPGRLAGRLRVALTTGASLSAVRVVG